VPRLTIAVCTRNRAAQLEITVEGLLADTSAIDREILLVDSASTDATRGVIASLAAGAATPIRGARLEREGVARARNLAIEAADSPLLAFTDDDVTVVDGWADAIAEPFEDPAVVAVGGRILPLWDGTPPYWLEGVAAQRVALVDYGPEAFDFVDGRNWPFGPNMAFRRSVLVEKGLRFNERLGHIGTVAFGCEEFELHHRLIAHGALRYSPDARAFHRIDPQRASWAGVRRSVYQCGFGLARSARIREAGEPSAPLARRLAAAARQVRRARAARRRNARLANPTPAQASEEFHEYQWAGAHLERLAGGWPSLADRLARRPP
jgi:glycosyltransferase involved in cell wall biosynthesis